VRAAAQEANSAILRTPVVADLLPGWTWRDPGGRAGQPRLSFPPLARTSEVFLKTWVPSNLRKPSRGA